MSDTVIPPPLFFATHTCAIVPNHYSNMYGELYIQSTVNASKVMQGE